ncbi:aromatic acid exporter family protein [Isoptericola sp. 178]|uniref:FUSC family protein n=1 Tax=Isoptericola sp. 178 TaxID=3064651 RepID=UPI002714397A|nr:hypothetical protein [Isoptericola sp. 178]MDO8143453.1 hypothetical protein [Isoptericola sp. 178]
MVEKRVAGVAQAMYWAWLRHPRWSIAARGALAAGVAWVVGIYVPHPLGDFPYYAPLGAIIATTSTLVRSVKDSYRVTVAVLLGAGIARLAQEFLPVGPFSIALVIGVALLCAGWKFFGDQGSWVANSALFVLILGNADALSFVGSFAGLVALGALVGIGLNLLLPPLPLTPTENALDGLSALLAGQVEDLAESLEESSDVDAEDWERRRVAIQPVLEETRVSVRESRDAAKAGRHPRVRRYRRWTEGQDARAQELETVAASVDVVVTLLVDTAEPVRLPEDLCEPLVGVLRSLAGVLRADAWGEDRDELVDALREQVRDFRRGVVERSSDPGEGLVVGSVAVALRRAADAFASTRPDAEEEMVRGETE